MRTRSKVLFAVAAIALVVGTLFGGLTLAQPGGTVNVPTIMNYQGTLLDAINDPVSGDLEFTFAIYDSAEGGTQLWTETQWVTVENGYYSVMLGEIEAIEANVFDETATYLEVSVGVEVIPPRHQLASAPYAFQAENAQTLEGNPASSFLMASGGTLTGSLIIQGNLDVEGTITMDPVIRSYSVPASAFLPYNPDDGYLRWPTFLVGGPGDFCATVNLPEGAEVTSMWAWMWDGSPSEDMHVYLERWDHGGGLSDSSTEMAHVQSSGADVSNVQVEIDTTIEYATIYNLFWSYVLRAESIEPPCGLDSVVIFYTIDQPLP